MLRKGRKRKYATLRDRERKYDRSRQEIYIRGDYLDEIIETSEVLGTSLSKVVRMAWDIYKRRSRLNTDEFPKDSSVSSRELAERIQNDILSALDNAQERNILIEYVDNIRSLTRRGVAKDLKVKVLPVVDIEEKLDALDALVAELDNEKV